MPSHSTFRLIDFYRKVQGVAVMHRRIYVVGFKNSLLVGNLTTTQVKYWWTCKISINLLIVDRKTCKSFKSNVLMACTEVLYSHSLILILEDNSGSDLCNSALRDLFQMRFCIFFCPTCWKHFDTDIILIARYIRNAEMISAHLIMPKMMIIMIRARTWGLWMMRLYSHRSTSEVGSVTTKLSH